jgi:bifunctional DNase/RNase
MKRRTTAAGFLAAVLVGAAPWTASEAEAQAPEARTPEAWVPVEVATVGVDLATGTPLALLRSGWDEVLPIWIGDNEASAIATVLVGQDLPRPMTHDLLLSVMETLGGELEEIRVTELRDATFLGVLRIRVNGRLEEVDTRPSDALALAVRKGARVVVARALLADLPPVDFLSMEASALESGPEAVARIRGVTVREPAGGQGGGAGAGLEVLHVDPAYAGRGLEAGDRILRVEGRAVRTVQDFAGAMTGRPPSAPIEVVRLRGGEEETVRVPPRRGAPVTG